SAASAASAIAAIAAIAAGAGAAVRINKNAIGVSPGAKRERPDQTVVYNRNVAACATSPAAARAAIAASAIAAIAAIAASATTPPDRSGGIPNLIFYRGIARTPGAARAARASGPETPSSAGSASAKAARRFFEDPVAARADSIKLPIID